MHYNSVCTDFLFFTFLRDQRQWAWIQFLIFQYISWQFFFTKERILFVTLIQCRERRIYFGRNIIKISVYERVSLISDRNLTIKNKTMTLLVKNMIKTWFFIQNLTNVVPTMNFIMKIGIIWLRNVRVSVTCLFYFTQNSHFPHKTINSSPKNLFSIKIPTVFQIQLVCLSIVVWLN